MAVKNILITTFISVVAFFLITSCTSKKTGDKPNFIIFIADDAAWDDAGCYGNQGIRTPNIDKLAAEGIKFNSAFLTTSSCSPSRCSILTGLYPHNTGAGELHMPLPSDKLLFPGELQKAGYYTVSAGKWHLGPERAEFDSIYQKRGPSGCEDWVRSVQNRPKDKPFFMWLASIDPHRTYEPNIIPEPHSPEDVVVPPFLPDNDSTRKDLSMYYDEIARLDSYIGKVMAVLKEQGVDKNTMVIYMTDNGRPFPSCKTRLLDSGIKTPFVVRWPEKIKSGIETNSLISSVDIAPTICELAGVELPEVFQGVSFAPVLTDTNFVSRNYVVAEHNWHDYQAHERSIRTDKFLYIRNAFPELNASPPADAVSSITYQEMIRLEKSGGLDKYQLDCFITPRSTEELYDVVNDRFQFNNLAGDPDYREQLIDMRDLLNKWIVETNDSVSVNPTPDKFDRWTGRRL
ncbi:Sulfatase [hydrothermal vent metagenome]|uniref:Sulfatase n=1 Tax=hydrothermal vent metagenome TaxID=652676 RepID=A0A3B0T9R7_9ZZZZ